VQGMACQSWKDQLGKLGVHNFSFIGHQSTYGKGLRGNQVWNASSWKGLTLIIIINLINNFISSKNPKAFKGITIFNPIKQNQKI